jgi:hypothetical protein
VRANTTVASLEVGIVREFTARVNLPWSVESADLWMKKCEHGDARNRETTNHEHRRKR